MDEVLERRSRTDLCYRNKNQVSQLSKRVLDSTDVYEDLRNFDRFRKPFLPFLFKFTDSTSYGNTKFVRLSITFSKRLL